MYNRCLPIVVAIMASIAVPNYCSAHSGSVLRVMAGFLPAIVVAVTVVIASIMGFFKRK